MNNIHLLFLCPKKGTGIQLLTAATNPIKVKDVLTHAIHTGKVSYGENLTKSAQIKELRKDWKNSTEKQLENTVNRKIVNGIYKIAEDGKEKTNE